MRRRVLPALVAAFAAACACAQEHGRRTQAAGPSLVESASAATLERDGTLSWKALGELTTVRRDNADGRYGRGVSYFAEPIVPERVRQLAGRTVRVHGYMLPRPPMEGKSHFLVSALPAADDDGCNAGGHASVVDVLMDGETRSEVDRRLTVEGKLTLYEARWEGFVYRLTDARVVEAR